jgi:hypothetical protein
MLNRSDISHIGDILAIPFFFLLCVYFYEKPRLTRTEQVLFLFAVSGFVLDILFTVSYLQG